MIDAVFGLVVPEIFLNFLGNIIKESFSIRNKIETFKTFQDLMEKLDFQNETITTLRNLLFHKIT